MPISLPHLRIWPAACTAGALLPLAVCPSGEVPPPFPCHRTPDCASLPVGSVLGEPPLFAVAGRVLLQGQERPCPLLKALASVSAMDAPAPLALTVKREGWAAACITLSDKGFAGQREDRSGPALLEALAARLPLRHSQRFLLPDDPAALRALTLELAIGQGYDLIVSTGGTGLAPRDLSPEALLPVLDRRLPGFEQAMMQFSLSQTPRAVLSRALAGSVGSCLILALPGSLRAATENLSAVLPALSHALEKLAGDDSDCGA